MGTLRTILALAVVFAHIPHFVFVGGEHAVQLFYMISGFLISYTLCETPAYKNHKLFWINRALRLFPIYYFVLFMTILWTMLCYYRGINTVLHGVGDLPFFSQLSLLLSHILIFGQDWMEFVGLGTDGLHIFGMVDHASKGRLSDFLLVPQAWTLGLELSFYLLVPFFYKNLKTLILILFLSISARILGIFLLGPAYTDPWNYKFFPFEISFFIIGILSHKLGLPIAVKLKNSMRYSYLAESAFVLCVGFCMIYSFLPGADAAKSAALFIVVAISLPFLFFFQNKYKLDRNIGELSYPIYICHVFVLMVIDPISKAIIHPQIYSYWFSRLSAPRAVLVVTTTIALSIILNQYVGRPVERLRRKLKL